MNKYILQILILLICLPNFAQNISGKYQRMDKDPGIEESTVISFNENSSFEELTSKHLGTSKIRKGNYQINGDTLVLNFQEPEQKDFVITTKNKISPSKISANIQTNLFLQTHFREEKVSETVIHFNDEDGDIIIGTTINYTGAFSLFTDEIKSLKISSLGKNDIEIDLKPILGYSSTIDIYLSNKKYENVNPKTQKFIVEKLKNENIKLTSASKTDIWILEKV